MALRDRNYLLDKNGNILKIVGDHHGRFVTAYVKYYPHPEGLKTYCGNAYMTNTQVFKSYHLLGEIPSAIRFVDTYGCVVTGRDQNDIITVFDARKKLQAIRQDASYDAHPVGRKLREVLRILERAIDSQSLGITGSFLTGMEDEGSDIDLVCYGRETYDQLKQLFSETREIARYEGKLFLELAKRRMSHMPTVSLEILEIQEQRKLQGTYKGTHINIQPLREEGHAQPLVDVSFVDMGDVAITARVTADAESIYSPAYFEVDSVSVLEGYAPTEVSKELRYVISFVGAYSQILEKGECFYAKGTLLRGVRGNEVFYALSIDPWNRGLDNKIQLVK